MGGEGEQTVAFIGFTQARSPGCYLAVTRLSAGYLATQTRSAPLCWLTPPSSQLSVPWCIPAYVAAKLAGAAPRAWGALAARLSQRALEVGMQPRSCCGQIRNLARSVVTSSEPGTATGLQELGVDSASAGVN